MVKAVNNLRISTRIGVSSWYSGQGEATMLRVASADDAVR